tara:strand:+ start:409 stop:654 length:246 start_codon:yes stop_codon:yes gene_type:complete
MAKYVLVRKTLDMGGKVEHHMQLDANQSLVLRYDTSQTEDVLDAACDVYLAERQAEADKQAIIDEAIRKAFMTPEELENVG